MNTNNVINIDSFTINQKGIEKLKKTITSLIEEKYGDAELNYDEVDDFVYEELDIIADALDDKCIEIKKEIFDKLKSLETLIDDKEKEINDIVEDYIYQNSVNESCGKRKPRKPFPRKSLKESAKARFLKKVFGRSKLSESRILKRTRKVKVPMNEATVNYLLRFTADGIKAGCLIGTKKDIDSIKRIYKNKSFKEIETYRLKSSDEETMYYQMEKLANSVKGKKGVDIRKTNDGKIGAIYFTDEYKGNEYKKILD